MVRNLSLEIRKDSPFPGKLELFLNQFGLSFKASRYKLNTKNNLSADLDQVFLLVFKISLDFSKNHKQR